MATNDSTVKVGVNDCNISASLATPTPTKTNQTIQMYDMDFTNGNWGFEIMADGTTLYRNLTSPVGEQELFYLQSRSIPTVNNNLGLPASKQPTGKGIQYGCRHEEVINVGASGCNNPDYMFGIISDFHVRHHNVSYVTDEIICEHVGKTISGLIKTGSTASTPLTRFAALVRGITQAN